MRKTPRGLPISNPLQESILVEHPSSGTQDDDDDRDDEHAGENEALQRETDENTEAPEEFEIADDEESRHPADGGADDHES